jgi:hypothetical protein
LTAGWHCTFHREDFEALDDAAAALEADDRKAKACAHDIVTDRAMTTTSDFTCGRDFGWVPKNKPKDKV